MRRTDDRRGQALVEFALVIPIVLLLICGLFDLGRIVFVNNTLSDGARHGARHASVDPRADDYCQVIDDAVRTAILGQPLATYDVVYQQIDPAGDPVGMQYVLCRNGANGPGKASLPASAKPGDRVTVILDAQVQLILGFVAQAVGFTTFDLHADSTMQVTFAPLSIP